VRWVEAADTPVVALVGFPLVEVDLLGADHARHTVAEGIGHGVGDRVPVDVDGMYRPGAVEGQLNAQNATATTDIEARSLLTDSLREQVLPAEEATLRGNEDARIHRQLGKRERIEGSTARIRPGHRFRLGHPTFLSHRDHRRAGMARLGLRHRGGHRPNVLRGGAAAAADTLGAFRRPRLRQTAILGRSDVLVESPPGADHVAKIRVDAEGQLGEVAKPPDHPRDVVDRQAVDEEGFDTHRLEAASRPTKEVALRGSPVLAIDAADAVAAAPEGEPDWDPGAE